MKVQMKRIAKNLYKRQYQIANGDWSTNYYGAFRFGPASGEHSHLAMT
jgi:hypothetical protein